MYNPLNDGVDHINIFSRGRTKLGRALSNFAPIPIKHHVFGYFSCLEAFWYWLSTGKQHDFLRELTGAGAKKAGRKLPRVKYSGFQPEFELGLWLKLEQNPGLRHELVNCTLPIVHYYYYGEPTNCKIVVPEGSEFVTDWFNNYRLQNASSVADRRIAADSRRTTLRQ